MPELIRSIAGRLRELVGNRRRAPRYVTHLEAGLALSVSLPNSMKTGGGRAAEPPLRLAGYTRDISATGLALIVPTVRIGGQYITGENRTLEIILKLPSDVIKLKAMPVRYTPLDEDGADTGYLIGVQIVWMSDADRLRFDTYLQTLTRE
jgi:hypothetical protein